MSTGTTNRCCRTTADFQRQFFFSTRQGCVCPCGQHFLPFFKKEVLSWHLFSRGLPAIS